MLLSVMVLVIITIPLRTVNMNIHKWFPLNYTAAWKDCLRWSMIKDLQQHYLQNDVFGVKVRPGGLGPTMGERCCTGPCRYKSVHKCGTQTRACIMGRQTFSNLLPLNGFTLRALASKIIITVQKAQFWGLLCFRKFNKVGTEPISCF